MARKQDPQPLIRGTCTHRRTEADYLGALLDVVTLDTWRDVVSATLELAKAGDKDARAWLGRYLIGEPKGTAPTPLTLVVNQLAGTDPLVERLARPHLERARFPSLHQDDDWEDSVKALVAAELATMLPPPETA